MNDIDRLKTYFRYKAKNTNKFDSHMFISSAECILKVYKTCESEEFICVNEYTKYTCSLFSHLVLFTAHLILDTKPIRFINIENDTILPYIFSIDDISLRRIAQSLEICVGIFDDIAGFDKLFDIYKNAYPDKIKRICELLLERNECDICIKAIILKELNKLDDHDSETNVGL